MCVEVFAGETYKDGERWGLAFRGEQLARSSRSNQRRVMGDVREKQPLSVLAGLLVIIMSNDDNSYGRLG